MRNTFARGNPKNPANHRAFVGELNARACSSYSMFAGSRQENFFSPRRRDAWQRRRPLFERDRFAGHLFFDLGREIETVGTDPLECPDTDERHNQQSGGADKPLELFPP